MFAAGNGIEQFAVLVENLDLEVAKDVAASLVVSNESVAGAAAAKKSCVAFRPSSTGFNVLDGLLVKQHGLLGHHLRSQRAQ